MDTLHGQTIYRKIHCESSKLYISIDYEIQQNAYFITLQNIFL